MLFTKTARNHDLDKRRNRRKFHKQLGAPLRAAARRCHSQEDVDAVIAGYNSRGEATAHEPVYDATLLRTSAITSAVGGITSVLAALALLKVDLDAAASWLDVLLRIFIAGGLVLGPALLAVGLQLRSSEHLPKTMTCTDVARHLKFVTDMQEDKRTAVGRWDALISTLLIAADAGLLMFMLVPLILPNQTPVVHMAIAAISAAIVTRIFKHLVEAVGRGLRMGEIVIERAHLGKRGTDAAVRTAAKYEDEYGPALHHHWPLAPSWWDRFGRAVPPAMTLMGLIGMLFFVRSILATDGAEMLGMVLIGVFLVVSLLLAIRMAYAGECLTPRVLIAKKVAARFPSVTDFAGEMLRDAQALDAVVKVAKPKLRAGLAPRTFSDAGHGTFDITDFGKTVHDHVKEVLDERARAARDFPPAPVGTVRAAASAARPTVAAAAASMPKAAPVGTVMPPMTMPVPPPLPTTVRGAYGAKRSTT